MLLDAITKLGDLPTGPSNQSSVDPVLNMSGSDAVGGFDYWLNKTESDARNGNAAAIDRLFNYYATEKSQKNALDWTALREDTQYQRLVKDLEAAGISPYILSSATPGVSSFTGHSYSGSQYTSKQNNENAQLTELLGSVLKLAGTAITFAAFMI